MVINICYGLVRSQRPSGDLGWSQPHLTSHRRSHVTKEDSCDSPAIPMIQDSLDSPAIPTIQQQPYIPVSGTKDINSI